MRSQSVQRSFAAQPDSVHDARRMVTRFAARAGASDEELDGIRLATSEAVTNAIIHGCGGGPGTVEVTVGLSHDALWILITDRGSADGDSIPGLGWGLSLMSSVSDGCTITRRRERGTDVRMQFELERLASSAATTEP